MQDTDGARAVAEHLMQEAGLNLQSKQFISHARRLSYLIIAGQSIEWALETVKDNDLRKKLRPFVYSIQLRMDVIVLQENFISPAQAEYLHTYLKERAEIALAQARL